MQNVKINSKRYIRLAQRELGILHGKGGTKGKDFALVCREESDTVVNQRLF